jgi:hypothetical protein
MYPARHGDSHCSSSTWAPAFDSRHHVEMLQQALNLNIPYFSIDNAHPMCNAQPNIFVTRFDVQITHIRRLAVELGSTDRGQTNSLKARELLVVIVKLEYLDVTVLRRGVGEVRVVAGRTPAC